MLTDMARQIDFATEERHRWIALRSRAWAEAHASGISWGTLARLSGVSETLVRREARPWKKKV